MYHKITKNKYDLVKIYELSNLCFESKFELNTFFSINSQLRFYTSNMTDHIRHHCLICPKKISTVFVQNTI